MLNFPEVWTCHHGALLWTGVLWRKHSHLYSNYSLDRLWIQLDPNQDEALTEDELIKMEASRLRTEVKHDDTDILASYQDRKILIVISDVDLLQQCGSNIILNVSILPEIITIPVINYNAYQNLFENLKDFVCLYQWDHFSGSFAILCDVKVCLDGA